LKSEYLESQTTARVLEMVKVEIKNIQSELSKSNFTEALHLARKLATAHGHLKIVTDTLENTQKRYNKGRLKEERLTAEKLKKDRFFKEAGLSKPD
jgi:predicted methyltransferase